QAEGGIRYRNVTGVQTCALPICQYRPGHGRRRPMSQNELSQNELSQTTLDELQQIIDRYPEPRSALLPMLHLLQSVQGSVTTEEIGRASCRERGSHRERENTWGG